MSSYAYKDYDREKIIYADQVNENELNNKYYFCPNKQCSAKMTLRSRKGMVSPYFAALRTHPHVNDCFVKSLGGPKDLQLDKDFSIDNFYESLISTVSKRNDTTKKDLKTYDKSKYSDTKNNINTVSKLFYFCEEHSLNYNINSLIKVGDIICDTRNNHLFTKFISGKKLFLCKFSNKRFPSKKYNHHTYFFKYPIEENAINHYTLIIKVVSNDIAKQLDIKLEKFKNNPIVLLIDCKSFNQYIYGEIFNPNQLAILK